MVQPVYASVNDYTTYTGQQVSDADRAEVIVRLRRASRVVDEMLLGAIYPTQIDEAPVDAAVRELFAEATSLQAAFFEETGDETGAGAALNGGSIGDVTLPNLSAQSARPNVQTARWSPEAFTLLRQSPSLRWGHYH